MLVEVIMHEDCVESDAESLFVPQLLLDLIQRLVECRILEPEEAFDLITCSLAKTAECNPAFSEAILRLSPFCQRFATLRKQKV